MLYWLNPLNVYRELTGLAMAWFWSRPWRKLYAAVPVLIALLSLVMLIIAWKTLDAGKRQSEDHKQIRLALAKQDYSTAKLLQEKWLRYNPKDEALRCEYTDVLWNLKSHRDAIKQLRALTFNNQNINAAARLLRCKYQIDLDRMQKTNRYTLEEQKHSNLSVDEYAHVLDLARQAEPNNFFFKSLAHRLFSAQHQSEKALALLTELSEKSAKHAYWLMHHQLKEGHSDEAKRLAIATSTANRGIRLCKQSKPPRPILESRFYNMTRRFPQALDTLKKSMRSIEITLQSEEDPRSQLRKNASKKLISLQQEVAHVLLRWSKYPPQKQSPEEWEFLTVSKAIAVAPHSEAAVNQMLDLAMKLADIPDTQFREFAKTIVESGQEPGFRHFVFGIVAILQEDSKTAESELQSAQNALPNVPHLLNNLAVVLAERKTQPDPEKALLFSSAAISKLPKHPLLRETRGQLYLKLEKYNDAIDEFSMALKLSSTNAKANVQAHEGLATAYNALGQTDMAAVHQESAKKLSAEINP